jgi:RNA polymerase sigma-70 factor (ECF subfamily)
MNLAEPNSSWRCILAVDNRKLDSRVTETDLIRSARRGDTAAWEALTRLHQEPVFRFAYLLLGDPDDAQDTAQETFIRAFYALRRFDDARPLRPWLMSITANQASNRRRSLGRYLAALTRLSHERDAFEPPPPGDDAQLLWQAVRRLKPDFQRAIYLRYFLELPEAEMAQALGVAPGTVKSRLNRALAALRDVIARDFPELKEMEA